MCHWHEQAGKQSPADVSERTRPATLRYAGGPSQVWAWDPEVNWAHPCCIVERLRSHPVSTCGLEEVRRWHGCRSASPRRRTRGNTLSRSSTAKTTTNAHWTSRDKVRGVLWRSSHSCEQPTQTAFPDARHIPVNSPRRRWKGKHEIIHWRHDVHLEETT